MVTRADAPVQWGELVDALRNKIRDQGLTLGEAGTQVGVSAASLSRILNRKSVPSSETVALIARWLETSAQRSIATGTEASLHAVLQYTSESTPQVVLAHLRADKNLSPETATALSEAFRALYDFYSAQERTRRAGND